MAAEGKAIDPIHQFHIQEIVPINLFGMNLSFTNASLFMVILFP